MDEFLVLGSVQLFFQINGIAVAEHLLLEVVLNNVDHLLRFMIVDHARYDLALLIHLHFENILLRIIQLSNFDWLLSQNFKCLRA